MRDDKDVRVLVGDWRWSPDATWPPVACVLKAPLWAADKYKDLRANLALPLPNPSLVVGGEFATIDSAGAAEGEPEDVDDDDDPEASEGVLRLPCPPKPTCTPSCRQPSQWATKKGRGDGKPSRSHLPPSSPSSQPAASPR